MQWRSGNVPELVARGAEGDLLASGDLYDGPNRVHDGFWLIDRDNVTGLLSRDHASSF